jgi:hypothetical protein
MMRPLPVFRKQARATGAGELPKANEERAGGGCRLVSRHHNTADNGRKRETPMVALRLE